MRDMTVPRRPRPTPADFMRDWGSNCCQLADLSKPGIIPATLVGLGIHKLIDWATGRAERSP
ncbi:hypothetical protein CASFOL_033165 [Castilleja foliolosa]|uniref:Uncharacterized protein n=1 Tax=Castilleja foliolosa TaxID=1961234 RepID=A0ABD3C4I4_9LAMI